MSAPNPSQVLPAPRGVRRDLLHTFFDDTTDRYADRIALDIPPGFGRPSRRTCTYRELAALASNLASLISPKTRADCVVAILLPRTSPAHYAAQLAVLMSGAVYTCIDPAFPDERVQTILQDSEAVAVLTDLDGLRRLAKSAPSGCELINALHVGPHGHDMRKVPRIQASHLAYLIYTSGTTGVPKAVMVEHRSISNLVASDLKHLGITPHDRVAQGSSSAYDSSIEETWFAFAAGATLVVLDDMTARSGPDLARWLREERITVFAPPPTQLRALGCKNPAAELPNVRLVFSGGEQLTDDLALLWSRGRELINDYGPTECTVTCLRSRIDGIHPVSIGTPVSNATAYVLNERLEQVPKLQLGELFVGGECLARGYWKHPELTAERFVSHPHYGRLYRTGDLVHQGEDGRFYYRGRVDAQIKLRGYRVELSEIETRLVAQPGVRAAACRAQQYGARTIIVAFVVPENAQTPPDPAALRAALSRTLPHYMVPARIGVLASLPTNTSGKLDRTALPALDEPQRGPRRGCIPPRDALEQKLHAAFMSALHIVSDCSIDDDFFDDLGGDSLSAAELVTALREDPDTEWLTARDIYEQRTISGLAALAPEPVLPAESADAVGGEGNATSVPAATRKTFVTIVQTAWLSKNLFIGSIVTYLAISWALPFAIETVGLVPLFVLAPVLLIAGLALYTLLSVLQAVAVKRRLIGTYKPARAPVWGTFYLRNWIVQESARAIPWPLIEGTEFQNAALRALGARIGERVHIHRGVNLQRGAWDLLEISDDATLSQDVALGLVEYESGNILIDRVSIGSGATIETNAYVSGGASVGENGYLTARSSLARSASLPAGERWDGVPAKPAGRAPAPGPPQGEARSPWTAAIWMVLARLLLAGTLFGITEGSIIFGAQALGVDDDRLLAWLMHPLLTPELVIGWVLVSVLPAPLLLGCEALLCRLMGKVSPGPMSIWSRDYIRVWLKTGLLNSSSNWLYGTMMWPLWLRLSGTKVGRGCEVSTLIDSVPELVEIGDRTFCTDGLYLGGPNIHHGVATLARNNVGSDVFLGNGALIPSGAAVPDGVLLGVCTKLDPMRVGEGTSWFGQPPFQLPRRQVVSMDPRLTHQPSPIRYAVRLFWELLRLGVTGIPAFLGLLWILGVTIAEAKLPYAIFLFLAVPTLSLGLITLNTAMVIGLKWLLLGRAKPGMHPLWSSWACRWDFICMAWAVNAREIVFALAGTVWLGWLLRAVGVRVGRGVMISPDFAADLATPDMLTFEDGTIVDGLFQDHTFEDRVLKMDYITIRRNAVLGRNAVLLYGSEVGAGSRVAPNSVVMKNEHLAPGNEYVGFPVRKAGKSACDDQSV